MGSKGLVWSPPPGMWGRLDPLNTGFSPVACEAGLQVEIKVIFKRSRGAFNRCRGHLGQKAALS